MGRPTKRAAHMRQRRLNEKEEDRENRLSQQRKSNSRTISKETCKERENRLSKMRVYMKKSVIHDRLSQETEEQRAHRLSVIHDRLSQETEEQRAHRLGLIHNRLSNETEEQRAHRLGLIHDRLSNETPETRSLRLSRMRQASHICRDIANEQSFEAAINIFADVPCAVCKRSLYPQQRSNLRADMFSTLLPEELVTLGTITTCSRCYNNIRKRKIPATAYWNKMMPAQVPPELANLTYAEERFLSRITPFLKIVKLDNRFSQNWCKGQVILFAKDVVEIAEQLPLTPHQAGLVLVVESLENLSCSK